MEPILASNSDMHYRGWPLRDRLELLAFDARLDGVPPALLKALWEPIQSPRRDASAVQRLTAIPAGSSSTARA
jgi:hypothetical protein